MMGEGEGGRKGREGGRKRREGGSEKKEGRAQSWMMRGPEKSRLGWPLNERPCLQELSGWKLCKKARPFFYTTGIGG